jgi:hypothetical protein
MHPLRKPVEPTSVPCPRGAEVIPHPMLRIRFAQERLRHVADIQSSFGRRRLLNDAVREHRKRLEQLGVSPARIEADVKKLEAALFALIAPHRTLYSGLLKSMGG